MTIQMVVVTKVMVDRSLELHGVTDKRAATTTTTILNQGDQNIITAAVEVGGIHRSTITPPVVAEVVVGDIHTVKIRLVVMICGDRTVPELRLLWQRDKCIVGFLQMTLHTEGYVSFFLFSTVCISVWFVCSVCIVWWYMALSVRTGR